MRIFFLLLFFPILSFAQERSISIDWDKVNGATSYEVEISSKEFNKKFNTTQTTLSTSLMPGKYQTKFRSLDHRKVPGVWSVPEFLIIPFSTPKFQHKVQNNILKLTTDPEFNKTEVSYSNKKESFTGSSFSLRLPAGIHELTLTSYKNNIPSDPKTLLIESTDEPLKNPSLYYFDNKINWGKIENAKEYLVKINEKEIKTNDNFIKMDSDKYQTVSVKSIGHNKYSPDSGFSTFTYDPKTEKYFSLPKKQIYLSYQIGSYDYKNVDLNNNSRINFSNTAGIGGVGFKYQSTFGLDLSYGFGGVRVSDVNYTFNELKAGVSYLHEFSSKNKFLLTLDQFQFEYYSFYAITNIMQSEKKNKSLTLIGLENQYYLNQRFLINSKIKYNPSLINPELNILYKVSPSWLGSAGISHKSYKLEGVQIENTYLNLSLIYGWE